MTNQIEDLQKEAKQRRIESNRARRQFLLELRQAQDALDTDLSPKLLQLQLSAARDKDLIRTLTEETTARRAEQEGLREQLKRAQEELKVRDEQILALQKAKDQTVTEVKDQLEVATTRMRRLLGLARERDTQWKEANRTLNEELRQTQLQLPVAARWLSG
uniref:Uncharacterized protein n=1 Tax=Knipowitschia caucasica TaxID=637954 RepID=A0AAV2K2B3_KNICA